MFSSRVESWRLMNVMKGRLGLELLFCDAGPRYDVNSDSSFRRTESMWVWTQQDAGYGAKHLRHSNTEPNYEYQKKFLAEAVGFYSNSALAGIWSVAVSHPSCFSTLAGDSIMWWLRWLFSYNCTPQSVSFIMTLQHGAMNSLISAIYLYL